MGSKEWSSKTLEMNCRPAFPLNAGQQFGRAVHAQLCQCQICLLMAVHKAMAAEEAGRLGGEEFNLRLNRARSYRAGGKQMVGAEGFEPPTTSV